MVESDDQQPVGEEGNVAQFVDIIVFDETPSRDQLLAKESHQFVLRMD